VKGAIRAPIRVDYGGFVPAICSGVPLKIIEVAPIAWRQFCTIGIERSAILVRCFVGRAMILGNQNLFKIDESRSPVRIHGVNARRFG